MKIFVRTIDPGEPDDSRLAVQVYFETDDPYHLPHGQVVIEIEKTKELTLEQIEQHAVEMTHRFLKDVVSQIESARSTSGR